MLKEKRPDIEIVGDELHPLLKVTDFSPYIAKIKASGADSVITGNWGQDIALLLKAAADAGLQTDWYTYYAGGAGGPTAIKQTGLSHRVFEIAEGVPNSAPEAAQKWETAFRAKEGVALFYPRAVNEMRMLAKAVNAGQVRRPKAIAAAARGHEDRGLRRRRRLHAQGRSSVLPAHLHRAASARSIPARSSTRRAPAGAGRRSAWSRRTTPSCRRPARWSGPDANRAGRRGDRCSDRALRRAIAPIARNGQLRMLAAHHLLDAERRALRHAALHDGERPDARSSA